MPASYIISMHTGSSTNLLVAVAFANGALPLKSSVVWVKMWDNPAIIRLLKTDGTYSDPIEFDNAWYPLPLPLAYLGFNIISKTPGLHARYQIGAFN